MELLLFLLFLLLVPVGIGVLIGIWIGKKRAENSTPQDRTSLATAWNEGYQAALKDFQQPSPTTTQSPLKPPEPTPAPVSTPVPPPQTVPLPPPPPPVPQLSPQELAQLEQKRRIRNANFTVYLSSVLLVAAAFLLISVAAPVIVRVGFLMIATGAFYLSGLFLHKQSPTLRQAGTAFTGTGLALYPVLCLALGVLVWPGQPVAWLFFSIIGTIGFSVAAALLNSRVVAFLTVPLLVSTAVAGGASLRAGMVWSFIFTIVLATAISWLVSEKPAWMKNIFVRAFVYTHEYLVPATLFALLLTYGAMTDGQVLAVLVAGLIYYITRVILAGDRYRLLYFTAARVLGLLVLSQALITLSLSSSLIQVVVALALAATIVIVAAQSSRYSAFISVSGRSDVFAQRWINADLALHAVVLGGIALAAESSFISGEYRVFDWRSFNLPTIIGLIGITAALLLHRKALTNERTDSATGSFTAACPLALLIIPFWLAHGGSTQLIEHWYRAEIIWLIATIALALTYYRFRPLAASETALSRTLAPLTQAIVVLTAMVAAFYVVSYHSWTLGADPYWPLAAAGFGYWAAVVVALGYAIRKIAREQFVRGYLFLGAALIGTTQPVSYGLGQQLVDADYGPGIAIAYTVAFAVVAVSCAAILLRSLKKTPNNLIKHLAMIGFILLLAAVQSAHVNFLNWVNPDAFTWLPWTIWLIIAATLFAAGTVSTPATARGVILGTPWYKAAGVIIGAYALHSALGTFELHQDLLLAIPLLVLAGYSVSALRGLSNPGAEDGAGERYTNLVVATNVVLAAAIVFIGSNGSAGSNGPLPHRWLEILCWLLLAAIALWQVVRNHISYLLVAVIALCGVLYAAQHNGDFSTGETTRWISPVWAASLSLVLVAGTVVLEFVRARPGTWATRWGRPASYFVTLASLIGIVGAISLSTHSYVIAGAWALVGLLLVARSHASPEGMLRPLSVLPFYAAAMYFSNELTHQVWELSADRLPEWLTIGFVGSALTYTVGAFFNGGEDGPKWARFTRLVGLGSFLLAVAVGWTDTKASLILAVCLTVVTLFGFLPDIKRSWHHWIYEIAAMGALLGAQRIYLDLPNTRFTGTTHFWFSQQFAVLLAMIALIAWLRVRRHTDRQPQHTGRLPKRTSGYTIASAVLITYGAVLLFVLPRTFSLEVAWLLTAFVAMVVLGTLRSSTGWIVWGAVGVLLTLLSFMAAAGFFILFILAAVLMVVGVRQLIKLGAPRQPQQHPHQFPPHAQQGPPPGPHQGQDQGPPQQ